MCRVSSCVRMMQLSRKFVRGAPLIVERECAVIRERLILPARSETAGPGLSRLDFSKALFWLPIRPDSSQGSALIRSSTLSWVDGKPLFSERVHKGGCFIFGALRDAGAVYSRARVVQAVTVSLLRKSSNTDSRKYGACYK